MGTLYLVATPIGNLEDISARALKILREARLIAAEDTRHTRKLLSAYGIHTPLISYHEHNKINRLDAVLAALQEGPVALVSDAGTPALNDPGAELVRAALDAGYPVSPIPGPAAPLAALVVSGLPTDAFLYLGYLPRRSSERQAFLRGVASLPYTLIFLEAPHRLPGALADLLVELGDRPAAAARELTKIHEEVLRGTLSSLIDHFKTLEPRGEFTLVIGGCQPAHPSRWPAEQLDQAIRTSIAGGERQRQAAQRLAAGSGWNSREIYDRIIREKKELSG